MHVRALLSCATDLASLLANATFEVQLTTLPPSDVLQAGVSLWHTLPTCRGPVTDATSAAALGLNRSTGCAAQGCNGIQCNLTFALPAARLRYNLAVRPQ